MTQASDKSSQHSLRLQLLTTYIWYVQHFEVNEIRLPALGATAEVMPAKGDGLCVLRSMLISQGQPDHDFMVEGLQDLAMQQRQDFIASNCQDEVVTLSIAPCPIRCCCAPLRCLSLSDVHNVNSTIMCCSACCGLKMQASYCSIPKILVTDCLSACKASTQLLSVLASQAILRLSVKKHIVSD